MEAITREEKLLSGQQLEPITRKELFLAKAAGMDVQAPEPITREEMFLSQISGGSGGSTPVVEPLSVTGNGTYTPPEGVDGYSPVTVNVLGGSHHTTAKVMCYPESALVTVGGVEYDDNIFFLFDVYPKTNGTVNVSCLGMTKSITDTSGLEKPEPQQVSFGKFADTDDNLNIVDGEVYTITVDGDFYGIANGVYTHTKSGVTTTVNIIGFYLE